MVSGRSLNRPSSPDRSASSWTTTTCARSRSSRPCRRTSPAQTRAGSGAWTRHGGRRVGRRRESKVESPLARLGRALHERSARFVLIGVGGANFYALGGSTVFMTEDRDLFLPLDPDNLVRCWSACEANGLDLWSGDEPLYSARDRWVDAGVEGQQDLTGAHGESMQVDMIDYR